MENKIYNAIKKGIANALVLDDDLPINYRRADIDIDQKITLPILSEIFKCDNDVLFVTDTSEFFTLIGNDGNEYPLSAYQNINPILLKIHVPDSSNEIIMAVHGQHYIASSIEWLSTHDMNAVRDKNTDDITYYGNRQTAMEDFDGFKHTQEINKRHKKAKYGYAAGYCKTREIKVLDTVYQGYLPAAGEALFIMKYIQLINYIFEKLKVNIFRDKLFIWTSSEMADDLAWTTFSGEILKANLKNTGNYYYYDKWYTVYTLPLFKKIN